MSYHQLFHCREVSVSETYIPDEGRGRITVYAPRFELVESYNNHAERADALAYVLRIAADRLVEQS